MRWRNALVAALDDLSLAGTAQRGLRLLAVLAAAGAWLAGAAAGAGDSELTLAILMLAAAWCAVTPDSHAGLVVPVALGWQWLAHLDRTTTGWALVAALALVVFHAAMTLAATAPAAADLRSDVVLPAAGRAGAVAVVTVVTWVAVRWSPATGHGGYPALTVAALVLLVVGAVLATVRATHGPPA
ncbi:MAG TPA: hypothetical protein VFL94_10085 [Actinomycetales bacterium]|nr:hypothetical protein [Actinomycetales bacterium]